MVAHTSPGWYSAPFTYTAHSVDTFVGDFKKSAIQAGPTQGSEQPGFQVALFDEYATSNDLIGHGEFVNHPIVLHQNSLVGGGEQHAFIGGAFMQDVLTVGQQVVRCAGLALVVSHQSLDHFAGVIFFTLDDNGIAAVVDNFKSNPGKISVPLRCAAGDAVLLLHAETAPLHFVHGSNGNRMVLLPYSDGFALPGEQHAFIGGRFPYLVGHFRPW